MKEYHKIQTVFLRDPDNRFKTLLEGEYSLPEFSFLKDNLWTFTEKVDGTNIRVSYEGSKDGAIRFGGRTDNAQIPADLVSALNELFLSKRDLFVEKFGNNDVCLYGEGYGPKIQKSVPCIERTKVLFSLM